MASKYPANKNGLPFGAYVLTGLGYPARVAGRSDALRTFVEAWGEGHEVGDERTGTLMPISRDDFEFMCFSMGLDPGEVQTPRLGRWDKDNEPPE